jgi:hypothetical protein
MERRLACNSTCLNGEGSGSKDSFVGNQIWLRASILRAEDGENRQLLAAEKRSGQ